MRLHYIENSYNCPEIKDLIKNLPECGINLLRGRDHLCVFSGVSARIGHVNKTILQVAQAVEKFLMNLKREILRHNLSNRAVDVTVPY